MMDHIIVVMKLDMIVNDGRYVYNGRMMAKPDGCALIKFQRMDGCQSPTQWDGHRFNRICRASWVMTLSEGSIFSQFSSGIL